MRKETYLRLSHNDIDHTSIDSQPVSDLPVKNEDSYLTVSYWNNKDIRNGYQIDQWFFGMLGAFITTIPGILIMICWGIFTLNYKLHFSNSDKISKSTAFFINFFAGIFIWILFFIL